MVPAVAKTASDIPDKSTHELWNVASAPSRSPPATRIVMSLPDESPNPRPLKLR
jgi:hypothetical protein